MTRDEMAELMAEVVVAAFNFTEGPCAPNEEWHTLCSVCERLTQADIGRSRGWKASA